jgi:putative hydrolase of the HAD superfamily
MSGRRTLAATFTRHAKRSSLAIKALMMDVDGVLVDGRPEDGSHWSTSLQEDFGFPADLLQELFFAPYWDRIVDGRAGLMEHLPTVLRQIAPGVSPESLVSYWFARDARLDVPLLRQLAEVRSAGIPVYLATNQEHLRAAYLMKELGLAEHVDGILYSARLGAAKPDADFFARAQVAVGLRAEDILLIDDSQRNIEAARNVGWKALHWVAHSSPDVVRRACM